jgi:ubiquinone/menaquinone biosynthesis C-methylase UbiE
MPKPDPKPGTDKLEAAYALKTPAEAIALYREFAATYDEEFVVDTGYVCAREVARVFLEHAGPQDRPVLDIGAGTGLLAESLAKIQAGIETDAIDISAEMLEKAAAKGLYRNCIAADLTQKLEIGDDSYGGLVSSGTFTHGHVGPEPVGELLRIARPGALFCLGINPQIFDQKGFGSAFAGLVAASRITPVDFREVRFYEGVDHEHVDDRGLVALFRKR